MSVGLGTDGAASNNRLNMFTEMGRAALLHKLTGHDPTLLPAAQVLDMGTLGGAAALHDPRLGAPCPRHGRGLRGPGPGRPQPATPL